MTDHDPTNVKDVEANLLRQHLQEVQPGDELGAKRAAKTAALQAPYFADLAALTPPLQE